MKYSLVIALLLASSSQAIRIRQDEASGVDTKGAEEKPIEEAGAEKMTEEKPMEDGAGSEEKAGGAMDDSMFEPVPLVSK